MNTPTGRLKSNASKGIMYMCLAVLLMPVMNACAKSLTVDYPVMQVVWARFTGHLVCMTLVFWPKRGWRLFQSANYPLQLARSAIMFLSNSVYIAALSTVALATASAIMFTAPLIVTALSAPFLGEKVGIRRWSAIVVGFIGALVIIRPGVTTPNFDASGLGLALLFASSTCFAIYQLLTRRGRDEHRLHRIDRRPCHVFRDASDLHRSQGYDRHQPVSDRRYSRWIYAVFRCQSA